MTDPAVLDAPPAPPPAAPTGPLADLILVRLLAGKKPPGGADLRKDVCKLFPRQPGGEQFNSAVEGLRAAGLLPPKRGFALTAEGRARALAYLGATELPPGTNWAMLQKRFLVPKALGLAPASAEAEQFHDTKTFAPRVLKWEQRLPVGTRNTDMGVFEALVCRQLGYPEESDLKAVLRLVFARAVDAAQPLAKAEAVKLVSRKLLGAKSAGSDAARAAVLARLTADGRPEPEPAAAEPPAEADEPFDLEAFAHTVSAAARTCPTGRFGDNKVFIAHVWRQLQDQPQIAPLGPDGFQAKLLDANRAGFLTLSRADLVQMMDPVDVRESETGHGTGAFHFVLVGGA